MKFNLKNRPKPPNELELVTGQKDYDYAEEWFEGFEKELQEKRKRKGQIPPYSQIMQAVEEAENEIIEEILGEAD